MRSRLAVSLTLFVVLTAGILGIASSPLLSIAHAQDTTAAGIAPDAAEIVGKMSKTLSAARQFSFETKTFRAYAGANGDLLHTFHDSKVTIRRPDRFSVETTGDDGATKMLYDGKNLIVYSIDHKQYSKIPVTGSIDSALDAAAERFHSDFPLADLLTDDPEKSVLSGVTAGGQVGVATIDGVQCRHFFFSQGADDLDLELWLEDNDKALPRRIVVVYRAIPGRPNFIAELSNWNLSAQAPDSAFEFTPPAGVTQAELNAKPPAPPQQK